MDPSEVGMYYARLLAAVSRLDLTVIKMGEVFGWPLFLLGTPRMERPRVLVAAGFHGEEQAGPWGLLHFLETAPVGLFIETHAFFLPLMNPSGFCKCRRCNDDGDSPNANYIHAREGEKLSAEGKALESSMYLLSGLAADGFMSLHEQGHSPGFYVYALEGTAEPSSVTLRLRDTGCRKFQVAADGLIPPPGGGEVRSGVVMNLHDGTFDDALFHLGVPRCYTTETPSSASFQERVETNAALVQSFLSRAV
jgi:hypothetical protein